MFRDFPTFSRTWIFFLRRLSLFWSSFFFSSLLFSDSSHLCFSSVHIVRSLTSELPSPKLAQGTPQYYLYYKACARHFPVLFCNTKLAQGTSQYYFVLQSLQRINPSTYVVPQSLHKALPSTTLSTKLAQGTLYYTACTRHFPVLLCTTKLAQGTSEYYFLYYKACTMNSPSAQSTAPATRNALLHARSVNIREPRSNFRLSAAKSHACHANALSHVQHITFSHFAYRQHAV